MSPHEVALIVFGAGLGSVATMFAMAYRAVREQERNVCSECGHNSHLDLICLAAIRSTQPIFCGCGDTL